jgi:hypothetical protein
LSQRYDEYKSVNWDFQEVQVSSVKM